MPFVAPIVVGGMVACRIWRWFTIRLEIRNQKPVRGALQWYSVMYIMLAALVAEALRTMHSVLAETDWLDMSATRIVVMNRDNYDNISTNMTLWDEEANLSGYDPLVWFSLSMPIWVLGTLVVSVGHTYFHQVEVEKTTGKDLLSDNIDRDKAITVIILPLLYGLMSFKAVIHVWQAVVNYKLGLTWLHTWEDRKAFYFEMYESCFMVGDLYEAVAVYIFADVMLNVIRIQAMKKTRRPLEESKKESSSKEFHIVMEEAVQQQEQLALSLHSTTVIGIRYFCIACLCQAAYCLTTTGFRYMNNPLPIPEETNTQVTAMLYGAGLLASCAAIENVVVVEHSFGHSLLTTMSPTQKFWSAKVLVSLSFLQKSLLSLPPFNAWSVTKQNLLFSSLVCFECFWISLFHCLAWNHREPWYDDMKTEEMDERIRKGDSSTSMQTSKSDSEAQKPLLSH